MPRSWIFGPLVVATLLVMTGAEASAQGTRFRVDWLFLQRDSDGPQTTLITGPDAFSTGSDFDYESGYRLFGSMGTCDYDVEIHFSRVEDWTDSVGAELATELSFDSEFNNGAAFPVPPANTFTFPNAIFDAAEYMNPMGADETLEAEFLNAGADALYYVETVYNDFDITIKTSRLNRHRVGLGFRHIDFDEDNGFRVGGIFGALGGDNMGLSHEALVAAGLTSVTGGGGFQAGEPLTVDVHAINDNNLNGLHVTYDGEFLNTPLFVFGVAANIGVYHNQITNELTESYLGGVNGTSLYSTSNSDSNNDLAVAGQLGFDAGVKLTDNWKLMAGYEAIFIDGLGLGINTPPASGDESVFMHGGRIGFEGVW
jgi:hypothetical protein